MGNYLPGTLSQFAAVFNPGVDRGYFVDQIVFAGDGSVIVIAG
jgi:hypothetical protein